MMAQNAQHTDLEPLSERLGRIRRALFLLESAERLKHLPDRRTEHRSNVSPRETVAVTPVGGRLRTR
jgi:hypothetical protein